jgi:preprotein translocase subunit SecB
MKLSIAQILLESAQFAHKGDFLSKAPGTPVAPSQVNLSVELKKSDDSNTAIIRLLVTNDSPEALYEFSVIYVLILNIDLEGEIPSDDLDKRLMITGAGMLFPFVRETVANLTTRGRFGPSWLAPTDFSQIVLRNTQTPTTPANLP